MDMIHDLLAWFETHRENHPWRKDKDPYRIWVSEIMLQQTQIQTVIPYYLRFMEKAPSIDALASLTQEEVYKLWEGLGYYSRARHLLKCAQVLKNDYYSSFPEDYETVLSLPGIGPYTAGAICSIAFNKATPAIDGNVLRLFALLWEEDRTIKDTSFKKDVHTYLLSHYPNEAGNYTEALMELGEKVCTVKNPDCGHCPIQAYCHSFLNKTVSFYPKAALKKEKRHDELNVMIYTCQNEVAIRKRDKGLLRGLYEFPNDEVDELWIEPSGETVMDYTHEFSHVRWLCHVYELNVLQKDKRYLWVSIDELKHYAFPSAFIKIVQYLEAKDDYSRRKN